MEPSMKVRKYGKLPPRNKALFRRLRKELLDLTPGHELTISEFRHSTQSRALTIAKECNIPITTRKNEDGTLSIYAL